uniref:D-isomer specific 2-hydroxyacid dehydrogenase NAD-binding domain-containing protein n=1 Tax=Kalanchoe fedtschenkoi TaxID=63787 RepID=A0A7N0UW58_KALFE
MVLDWKVSVDVNAATSHGIKVARIPSDITGNAASCAEMAIYLMLGLLRKQNEMKIAVEQKRLGEPIGDTLLEKTVFILGYGNIGIELAKRLRPFGVKIVATKRSWAPNIDSRDKFNGFLKENPGDALVDKKGIHQDMYEMARIADIVVCCLRQDNETVGIVDQKFLSSMKKIVLNWTELNWSDLKFGYL